MLRPHVYFNIYNIICRYINTCLFLCKSGFVCLGLPSSNANSQTAAFVTFNKVVTSQYFVWYLCFVPLIAPHLALSPKRAGIMAASWFAAQVRGHLACIALPIYSSFPH